MTINTVNSVNFDKMLHDYKSGEGSMLEQINAEDSSDDDDSMLSNLGKEAPLEQQNKAKARLMHSMYER